ncbi:FAD-dependent oxidoreductase [Paludibacterium sp. B53371]|uniref:FAD-dependent oxidoreductase n=1 Tax=Paludibacterium sp. B53371 TaxID=2806263 RepID=UPI00207B27FA|nr:FAD-dependent oxidoreductase [Paludibacterium sp. B53371]
MLYGVWDGKVYDFRKQAASDEAVIPGLSGLEVFAPENPVKVFVADRGFMVFDASANLAGAFWQYLARAADESCGKCTPCRVGTVELRDQLDLLRRGDEPAGGLHSLRMLAHLLATTSLCGLGQSSGKALMDALTHFPSEFSGKAPVAEQNGVIYTTAPCIEACPSRLDVPRYIDSIREGRNTQAMEVILDKYPMAASCGRVCVRFCESACRRTKAEGALAIKMLKRFASDKAYASSKSFFNKERVRPVLPARKKVAVVGAGPAGVTCAYQLLKQGIDVDVIDMQHKAGGMASVGIPSYRLPKDVLKAETEDAIVSLGGKMVYGRKLGEDFSVNDLFAEGYDSVFLGYGASRGTLLGVKDEDPSLKGYFSGIDFLKAVHDRVEDGVPFEVNGEVIVVGGGNVAMDCVRSALRLGARKVHLVYRRTVADMPADHEEIEASEKEGIVFHCLTNPSRLIADNGRVVGVEVVDMRQTEVDARGRRNVEAVEGSEHVLKCDVVIAAIGQQVDRATLGEADGIETDRWGCVVADKDTMTTSREGVFAGGDCVLGPQTLIQAMAHGERAALSIVQYLQGQQPSVLPEQRMQALIAANKLLKGDCLQREPMPKPRQAVPEQPVEDRVGNFTEVELALTQRDAYLESERCLRCYRHYLVVTENPLAHTARAAEFA